MQVGILSLLLRNLLVHLVETIADHFESLTFCLVLVFAQEILDIHRRSAIATTLAVGHGLVHMLAGRVPVISCTRDQ